MSAVTLEHAIEAVREVLPARRRRTAVVTAGTRFDEDLGMTSLDVAEVFVKLEDKVGHALDTSGLEQTRTVRDLLEVERAEEERAW